jgi:hypothetical protein
LKGGGDSQICRWLGAYVEASRRVVLGFTGATVADLAMLNPKPFASSTIIRLTSKCC